MVKKENWVVFDVDQGRRILDEDRIEDWLAERFDLDVALGLNDTVFYKDAAEEFISYEPLHEK